MAGTLGSVAAGTELLSASVCRDQAHHPANVEEPRKHLGDLMQKAECGSPSIYAFRGYNMEP